MMDRRQDKATFTNLRYLFGLLLMLSMISIFLFGLVPKGIEATVNHVLLGKNVIQTELTRSTTAVLTDGGDVFTFGRNTAGSLGVDSSTYYNASSPQNITSRFNLTGSDRIISLGSADYTFSALSAEGKVFIWGDASAGLAGYGGNFSQKVPLDITAYIQSALGNPSDGEKVVLLEIGTSNALAITDKGHVLTWGTNVATTNGFAGFQLTTGNVTGAVGNGQTTGIYNTPVLISGYGDLNGVTFDPTTGDEIISISVGAGGSFILTESGRVFAWGNSYFGQLGNGTSGATAYQTTPQEITDRFPAGEQVVQIQMGFHNSVAVTEDSNGNHKIYGWGIGQTIGLYNNMSNKSTPTNITTDLANAGFQAGEKVLTVRVGGYYTCTVLVTDLGKVFTWGYNDYGRLGDGTMTQRTVPVNITSGFTLLDPDEVIISANVSTTGTHTMGISNLGRIYGWGNNEYGQLGFEIGNTGTNQAFLRPLRSTDVSGIIFVENSGSIVNDIIQTQGTALTEPSGPTRSGYAFGGWYTDNTTFANRYAFPSSMPSSNVTLYAQWVPTTSQTLSFDRQGGLYNGSASNPADLTGSAGTAITLPSNLTRSGYEFAGWYKENTYVTAYPFSTMPYNGATNSTTLYAKWTPLEYTISYNLTGGSNYAGAPGTYTIESSEVTLGTPTRNGYSFGGWYGNAGLTGSVLTSIPAGSTGNLELHAKWNAIPDTPQTPTPTGSVTSTISTTTKNEVISETTKSIDDVKVTIQTSVGAIVKDLLKAIGISQTEIEEGVSIKMSVNVVEKETIQTKDQALFEEYLEENHSFTEEAITYLDVSLFKVQGTTESPVDELDTPVIISFIVPEEFRGKSFLLLHLHNGQVDEVEYTYESKTHTVTFQTATFSTYTLVYDQGEKNQIPQWIWPIAVVGSISLIALAALLLRRKKKA